MIKARKGFVPVLLALMTIFVFVPTMAFAQIGGAVSWGDKYATVTVTDEEGQGHTFDTKRAFSSDGLYAGMITAVPQPDQSTLPPTQPPQVNAYFYDLDGSVFTLPNGATIDKKTVTQEYFENVILNNLGVTLVQPDYTEDYDAKNPQTAFFAINCDSMTSGPDEYYIELSNWTLTFDMSKYNFDSTEDQEVTFSVKSIDPWNDVDPTSGETADLDGTVAEATVTVKGEPLTPQEADFYFDSTDNVFGGGEYYGNRYYVEGVYDGASHTIVCDEVEGWTVAYQIYNKKTGKWGDVLAVSVTDVEEAVRAKAIFTNTKTKETKSREFYAQLYSGLGVDIGWNQDDSLHDPGAYRPYYYGVPGTEYNPADYIVSEAWQLPVKNSSEHKDILKALNEASEKAFEANKETINAYFNDYYEVKETTTKAHPELVTLNIQEKDLSKEEKEALDEKYAKLLANFETEYGEGTGHGLYVDTESAAYVELNYAALDDEILFTNAPDMTYHVKKAKKMKKTKSFTVEAVAASGKTVSYKIDSPSKKITINAETGKISVKKGLKKGTYKVLVIATTEAGANYKAATAYRPLTIKVKK